MSLMRSPGRHALPGAIPPETLGMTPEDITLPREEWSARVLRGMCESALGHSGGLFVDYRQLPDAVADRIAPHFGLALDDGQIARVRVAACVNAKNPSASFTSDALEKQVEGRRFAGLVSDLGLDLDLCATGSASRGLKSR